MPAIVEPSRWKNRKRFRRRGFIRQFPGEDLLGEYIAIVVVSPGSTGINIRHGFAALIADQGALAYRRQIVIRLRHVPDSVRVRSFEQILRRAVGNALKL